jgi:hypothetical protein
MSSEMPNKKMPDEVCTLLVYIEATQSLLLTCLQEFLTIIWDVFYYICVMKAMVITAKTRTEYKFLSDLLKKLGITSSMVSEEELEDLGLSKMLKSVNKRKKVSKESIMLKLKS